MEMLIDVILDTLLDAAKLFPFLLLTYIAMELLEHHAGDKSVAWLKKSGKLGPVIGAVTGLFPQMRIFGSSFQFVCRPRDLDGYADRGLFINVG